MGMTVVPAGHVQVLQFEHFGGTQHPLGDHGFQVLVHDVFFLVGQFLELFEDRFSSSSDRS
jgi:hypothetical protein